MDFLVYSCHESRDAYTEKAHHFAPLRIPLREQKTIKITEYIKEMA